METTESGTQPVSRSENVVICGISCRLPESDNMEEFRDNLMNGVDMVTEDDRRWKPGRSKINGDFLKNGLHLF